MYQPSLSHSSGRDEGYVPFISECSANLIALGYAVAEVFRTLVAIYHKRVVQSCRHIIALIALRKLRNKDWKNQIFGQHCECLLGAGKKLIRLKTQEAPYGATQ